MSLPIQSRVRPSVVVKAMLIGLLFSLGTAPTVNSQDETLPAAVKLLNSAKNAETNAPTPPPVASSNTELAAGSIHLDGYKLFQIAAPLAASSGKGTQPNSLTPIQQRINNIEDNLQRVVSSRYDPTASQISATIDASSKLPVIAADGQTIMTVTALDVQLQGTDFKETTQKYTAHLQTALVRAKQERELNFLLQRGLIAAGIILGMGILSWQTRRWQHRLKTQGDSLSETAEATPSTGEVAANLSVATLFPTIVSLQDRLSQQQQLNLNEIQQRSLQLAQVGIWGGGTFLILGLFPYTRWLQPFVLSTPLALLGIGFGTYLAIRLSAIAIDRFFSALQAGEFISPEASVRLALRVSTISRVLKSVISILLISTGGLGALSLLGVDLLPLLAGAGLVGLVLSLASQNLIKDMINGFLILLEDQYAVGDVINVGGMAGLVENMNLRITQLRNGEGRLITIPNSTIAVVENLSKEWARVDLAIKLAYEADPDRSLEVLKQIAATFYADSTWRAKLIGAPEVLGIDELDETGMLIRIWLKTQPLEQWSVAREFRRRLKLGLEEHQIPISLPQQMITFHDQLPVQVALRGNSQKKAVAVEMEN
jgi:moderate conductance mechanosensitive channel